MNELLEEETTSEFGTGFTYCIGMFLAHADRDYGDGNQSLWFNGAADHLFSLSIPKTVPDALRKEIEGFQEKCLNWRHDYCSKKDKEWALEKAKDILREADHLLGVKTIKADWS